MNIYEAAGGGGSGSSSGSGCGSGSGGSNSSFLSHAIASAPAANKKLKTSGGGGGGGGGGAGSGADSESDGDGTASPTQSVGPLTNVLTTAMGEDEMLARAGKSPGTDHQRLIERQNRPLYLREVERVLIETAPLPPFHRLVSHTLTKSLSANAARILARPTATGAAAAASASATTTRTGLLLPDLVRIVLGYIPTARPEFTLPPSKLRMCFGSIGLAYVTQEEAPAPEPSTDAVSLLSMTAPPPPPAPTIKPFLAGMSWLHNKTAAAPAANREEEITAVHLPLHSMIVKAFESHLLGHYPRYRAGSMTGDTDLERSIDKWNSLSDELKSVFFDSQIDSRGAGTSLRAWQPTPPEHRVYMRIRDSFTAQLRDWLNEQSPVLYRAGSHAAAIKAKKATNKYSTTANDRKYNRIESGTAPLEAIEATVEAANARGGREPRGGPVRAVSLRSASGDWFQRQFFR